MGSLTYHTAGESHGRGCFALVEGLPFGLPADAAAIDLQLARRQRGYGRGARQEIEKDKVEFLSGVRHGRTMGSPVLLAVWNKDSRLEAVPELECPRPGHADLAGHLKYGAPVRDVLERASARETAARVAAGSLCRLFLGEFAIEVRSHVVAIGKEETPPGFAPAWEELEGADQSEVRCPHPAAAARMKAAIDEAGRSGDTLGGIFEVVARGVPVGLGEHAQWDRRLDGAIGQVFMSMQAIKGVEVGLGFRGALMPGSRVHDRILYEPSRLPRRDGGFSRPTNGAGGLEGGISNGMPIVVRCAMKPLSTLRTPLASVNLTSGAPNKACYERSDICAVPAGSVVGESLLAFVLARAFCEKFGGDSLAEMRRNYLGYLAEINRARGDSEVTS